MDSWMFAPIRAAAQHSPESDRQPMSLSAFNSTPTPDNNGRGSHIHAKASIGAPRIRRRNRVITSCLECRRRKLKCDKLVPCTNCTRLHQDCLYLAPADNHAQQKLADIKERMGALERNLEREAASQSLGKGHLGGTKIVKPVTTDEGVKTLEPDEDDDDEDEVAHEDEVSLEPTPLAALDNVYETNGDDDMMDLGVQMGKMRISERIGGWIRPKLVEELTDTLADVKYGKSRHSTSPTSDDHRTLRPAPKLQPAPISYIGPGPDYIAPATSFFFSGSGMSTNILDYLPSRHAADILIEQYWKAVHYMCKIVHRPSFEAQYSVFWATINTGNEPIPPVQAIIFAAMFSAAVSLTEEQTLALFAENKNVLVDRLRSGTEMALARANFLRTTKIDTIQAFTMYLIPLVRAEVSRAHSALVGAAIRLAECMGLHRDGTFYDMGPIEVQVRRMIWHQLSFLDIRTCEATGPRPQIRRDDYDTKLPWNVDDVDLMGPNPLTRDKSTWTDMTFMRLRAECSDMRRQVWFDITAVDKKKKTLTSLLVKIQKFRKALEETYLPMIDPNRPFQALAKLILELGTRSLHLQSLHRYLFSTSQKMPDRLRQVLIEAGLIQMETAIQYEKTPEFEPWFWYKGAFNQYHSALLLMIEVYAYPMRKEAARIWTCLDYIFEIPSHLAPKEKAELVISDLKDRMTVYQNMRKLKVSNQMEQRVSGGNKSYLRAVQSASGVVDATGQMHQNSSIASGGYGPPTGSPESPSMSGSRGVSEVTSGDTSGNLSMMEEIDWSEFEKFYHHTGELNIPDYDMADFHGAGAGGAGFNVSPMNPSMFTAARTTNIQDMSNLPLNVPSAADLADVNLSSLPMYAPRPGEPSYEYPHY